MTYDFIIGVTDTDSTSYCKPDMSDFTKEERKQLLDELNSVSPDMILWEDDGYYKTVICLKAKNYILVDEKNSIKFRGSAIRDKKKEPAMLEMLDVMIKSIIDGKESELVSIYKTYIREAMAPADIRRWSSKKTITKAVLNCATDPEARLNERKVYDAVKAIPGLQEGDKAYVYPNVVSRTVERRELKNGKIKEKITVETALKNADDWTGDHDPDKLVERVVATVDIFSNVIDNSQFVDYTLVKNRPLLEELMRETN